MTDIKVSVIIPVYNAEKNLKQCLDSVCGQTLKEIEIICVDDGSTDSSPAILEEYRQKDPRIQVLHQQNSYAGTARNKGKAAARGDYLVFWDADDYFALKALERMYGKIVKDQADICVCGAFHYFEDSDLEVPSSSHLQMQRVPKRVPFNRESNQEYILNFTGAVPWNKMFRRAFVEENQLEFQPIRNGNDLFFVECALCLAEKITVVDERLVYYRKNQSSSLVGTISKSPLIPFEAWCDVRSFLLNRGILPERSFANKALDSVYSLLSYSCGNWTAFVEAVRFLQTGGLERLGLQEREQGYFYSQRNERMLSALLRCTPEDFAAFFSQENFLRWQQANAKKAQLYSVLKGKNQELRELKRSYKKLENEKKSLRNSREYRIGRMVLWLPRKLKGLLRRLSGHKQR